MRYNTTWPPPLTVSLSPCTKREDSSSSFVLVIRLNPASRIQSLQHQHYTFSPEKGHSLTHLYLQYSLQIFILIADIEYGARHPLEYVDALGYPAYYMQQRVFYQQHSRSYGLGRRCLGRSE